MTLASAGAPSAKRRRALPWVGAALILAALVFVAIRVSASWEELSGWSPVEPIAGPLLALVAGATLASTLTIGVWLAALGARGPLEASLGTLARIHAVTQIVKYLPGNVLHLAGRHVATRRALEAGAWGGRGGTNGAVAGAAVVEAAILALSAALTVALFAARWPHGGPEAVVAASRTSGVSLVLPFVVLSVLVVAAVRFAKPPGRSLRAGPLLVGLLVGSVFFVTQALLLLCTTALVTGDWVPTALAAAPVGWLLGFVTPGAPAGFGVREAVLIGLLGPTLGAGDAVLATVFFRLVTLGGDVVLFSAAAWPGRRVFEMADRVG